MTIAGPEMAIAAMTPFNDVDAGTPHSAIQEVRSTMEMIYGKRECDKTFRGMGFGRAWVVDFGVVWWG